MMGSARMMRHLFIVRALCAVIVLLAAAGRVLSADAPGPSARAELRAVLSAFPDRQRGAKIFRLCAECHGAQGQGIAEAFTPAIAGQYARVLAKQLVDYRHAVRWDFRMQKIAGRHVLASTQDIADIVAYVGQLSPPPRTSVGTGQWLHRGERLYGALCRTCHGAQGEGSAARFVPRIAGQRYDYLLRQLHDTVEGRRPSMAAIHERALRKLDVQDLDGLADYISELVPSALHRVSR